MNKKRSVALLISAILGVFYSIYLIVYFGGALGTASDSAEAAGGVIATALVTPHMICVVIAAIFNVAGWWLNKRGFALVGAILYTVSAVLFLIYAMFVIPSMILSFVGYVRLKNINRIDTMQVV